MVWRGFVIFPLVSDSVSFLKDKSLVYNKNDSLATRAKKLQAIKERNSEGVTKRIQIKEVKTISEEPTNHDVQFLIQVIICCADFPYPQLLIGIYF